jgi:hypothetical protein
MVRPATGGSCCRKHLSSRVRDVTRLGLPPFTGYLCPLDANVYGIEFLKFEIRDYESNKAVYQVRRLVTDQKVASCKVCQSIH